MEQIEDSELIARILDGDRGAFAVLVDRYSPQVYAQIARSVRLVDDIEDLVQIAFVKVYENLRQLREHDRFRAWLYSTVRNAVNSHHRRRAVQLRLEKAFYSEPDVSRDAEEEVESVVRSALHILSAEHRQVIAYHYFKGYSYAETADLLDLTVETVRGRLRRARLKLKGALKKMSDIHKQTFELDREDLDALKKVGGFVSNDEKRPIMQGICLDVGGRAIATNGHILIIRTLKSLVGLASPIVVGPWSDCVERLARDTATLKISEATAEIQSNGFGVSLPLIEGPFVKYEQVIPREDPVMRISVSSDLLARAMDLLADMMDERHPASDGWQYRPQMALHLSPLTQTVTFLTARDMGYSRPVADGKVQSFIESKEKVSPGGAVDWTFQVPINAKFEVPSAMQRQGLRLGVNFAYFKQVLQALAFEACDEMVLEIRGSEKAILFRTPLNAEWLALVMPMRLKKPGRR